MVHVSDRPGSTPVPWSFGSRRPWIICDRMIPSVRACDHTGSSLSGMVVYAHDNVPPRTTGPPAAAAVVGAAAPAGVIVGAAAAAGVPPVVAAAGFAAAVAAGACAAGAAGVHALSTRAMAPIAGASDR